MWKYYTGLEQEAVRAERGVNKLRLDSIFVCIKILKNEQTIQTLYLMFIVVVFGPLQ